MVKYLTNVGTGVSGFGFIEVSLEENDFPKKLVDDVVKKLKPGRQMGILVEGRKTQRYIFSKAKDGKLAVSKLVLKHKMSDCDEETAFDTDDESDGTNRLMDILPILSMSDKKPMIFFIDELDRSLHPNLCYQFIQDFLAKSGESQLIVTTHESNLLTFDLLRRDEIWFVEKNKQGATALYSMEEFTPRYDKDVQKGYLLGRFGAIPIIGEKPF
jgi:AAA15 family ATPase/GTPase